jgi:hypothetical protein
MAQATTSSRFFLPACALLTLLCLAHYWYVLSQFLLNAPDSDDYVDVLWFLEIWENAETFRQKMNALLLPIHEHITLVSHLIYAAHYALFNEINFTHYILIGQVILISICLTLASLFAKKTGWLIGLMLAFLFYLNLSYWHSSFWAMTAISNQVVILFALLAIRSFCLHPDKPTLSIVFAVAGCFSQANGLAILLTLFVMLLWNQYRKRETKLTAPIVSTGTLGLLILCFYLIHQNPFDSDHHLDHQALTTEPELIELYQRDISGTSGLTYSVPQGVYSILMIAGAGTLKPEQKTLAAFTGAALLFFWLFMFRKNKSVEPFVACILLFTLISILLVAFMRGAMAPEHVGLLSRYRMYSHLLLALTAYQVIHVYGNKKSICWAVLTIGTLLHVFSRWHLPAIAANYHSLTTSYYHWLVDGGFGRSTMPIYPPNQDRRLKTAIDQQRYHPIRAIPVRHLPSVIHPADELTSKCRIDDHAASAIGSIKAYSKKPKALATELKIHLKHPFHKLDSDKTDVLFCGKTATFVMQLSARNLNTQNHQYWPLLLEKTQLPRDRYHVLIFHKNHQGFLGNIVVK